MNPQTPSVPPTSGERPLQAAGEQTIAYPDKLIAPPAETPLPQAVPAAASHLTASDVAAAIAQMPAATPPAAPPAANPVVAADVDVIEPEWVEQAESVIEKTAGDPHAEEAAVEALQVDYLKKRYGHNVNPSGDQ
jgi:hypothetical protein